MEMLVLFYGLIAFIAIGMLVYMKLGNKKKLGSFSKIPGDTLLLVVLAFVILLVAFVMNVFDVENRIITLLNTICNFLLLICIVSLNKR